MSLVFLAKTHSQVSTLWYRISHIRKKKSTVRLWHTAKLPLLAIFSKSEVKWHCAVKANTNEPCTLCGENRLCVSWICGMLFTLPKFFNGFCNICSSPSVKQSRPNVMLSIATSAWEFQPQVARSCSWNLCNKIEILEKTKGQGRKKTPIPKNTMLPYHQIMIINI